MSDSLFYDILDKHVNALFSELKAAVDKNELSFHEVARLLNQYGIDEDWYQYYEY